MKKYELGSKVLRRGENTENIIFVAVGEVEMLLEPPNREFIPVKILGPGSTLYLYSILSGLSL